MWFKKKKQQQKKQNKKLGVWRGFLILASKPETTKTINLTTKVNREVYMWGNIFPLKTCINTTWKLEISSQWIADLGAGGRNTNSRDQNKGRPWKENVKLTLGFADFYDIKACILKDIN